MAGKHGTRSLDQSRCSFFTTDQSEPSLGNRFAWPAWNMLFTPREGGGRQTCWLLITQLAWKALFHYNNDLINSLNSKANVMKSNEKLIHFKPL